MAYVFDEVKLSRDEGADWWQTIKKIPVTLLDQNFGYEVPISDLMPILNGKPKESSETSSQSKGDQDSSQKVLSLDSLNRRDEAILKTGHSKVTFDKEFFEAELSCTQFNQTSFKVAVEKGFLVINASEKAAKEGDGTVWRFLERRYMLPHDCHVSNMNKQLQIQAIDNGLKVKVLKRYVKRTEEKKNSPGRSPPGKSQLENVPPVMTTPIKTATTTTLSPPTKSPKSPKRSKARHPAIRSPGKDSRKAMFE